MTEITDLYVRGCALEHLMYHARKRGKHLAADRFRDEALLKLIKAARLKADECGETTRRIVEAELADLIPLGWPMK